MQPFPAWRRALIPLATLLYLTMLVLGATLTVLPDPLQQSNDKLLHLLAYGGLAGLLFLGLQRPTLQRCGIVILTIAVLGGVDEAIQSLFPHRHSDVMDWLADVAAACGACLGLSVLRQYHRAI